MSFGVPVISTNIGADGIDFTENKNILINDSPEVFAQCIINSLIETENSRSIVKNSLKPMSEKYIWSKIVDSFLTSILRACI
jgi:glycosyltransferase involved in cell wall biosynthesis